MLGWRGGGERRTGGEGGAIQDRRIRVSYQYTCSVLIFRVADAPLLSPPSFLLFVFVVFVRWLPDRAERHSPFPLSLVVSSLSSLLNAADTAMWECIMHTNTRGARNTWKTGELLPPFKSHGPMDEQPSGTACTTMSTPTSRAS